MIPYGRHIIDKDDIAAVVSVLESDWLTTGPMVSLFEESFAKFVGTDHGVAVSSGTAALHAAMHAAGIGPGDEVIVPAITFAATANAVVFQRGNPVFVDVDPDTLLISPEEVKERVTPRTKAIVSVDYAGQPSDYDRLTKIADRFGILQISDACHSLGAEYKGRIVGSQADITVFSFHPVKHITTGEGGMLVTNDAMMAEKVKRFRNHGIDRDYSQRSAENSWYYEISDLGYNYRITDFQCALGLSQLKKLPGWLRRRREIASMYDKAFKSLEALRPLSVLQYAKHAYHLYVIRVNSDKSALDRDSLFKYLREQGIGVNVHYIPVHLHPFYRRTFGTQPGKCPNAEDAYEEILSLPIFPSMTDADVSYVIETVRAGVERGGK